MNLTQAVAELQLRRKNDPENTVRLFAEAQDLYGKFEQAVESADTAGKLALWGEHSQALVTLTDIRAQLLQERKAREQEIDATFAADRTNRPAGSQGKLWLPSLAEYQQKAASIGNDAQGGFLVQDALGPLVDRLRPASVMLQSGIRVIPMTTDAVELPRLGTSCTVYAVPENGAFTESSPAFERVRLSSRKYTVLSRGSIEWFQDTGAEGRRILQDDMNQQLAAKFDAEMLQGSGSASSPIVGLRNLSGITKTVVASDSNNGGLPALGDVLDAIDRLERDNATPSAIFMHPRTWATFRKLDDQQDRLQLTPNPSDEAAKRLFGLPVYTSSQISIAETRGSNSDTSYLIVADTSQIVAGIRTQFGVIYDPYSYASQGQIQIAAHSRLAFNVLATEAVEIVYGIRTS